MTNTTEEQLVSFFLYSLFIYPVTNYLVSPKRSYPRWKGACYAMLFLVAISSVHMVRGLDVHPLLTPILLVHVIPPQMYENREKGPNHYNLLGVARGTSTANLKRAYRNLSLELHPDKNKCAFEVSLPFAPPASHVTCIVHPGPPRLQKSFAR